MMRFPLKCIIFFVLFMSRAFKRVILNIREMFVPEA